MNDDLPPEMIEAYLNRRKMDLTVIENSIAQNAVEDINRIGHQLLGNANSFGFPELNPIAHDMESLSQSELKTRGPDILNQFKTWLASKSKVN